MWLIVALLASLAGWTGLAMAMPKHFRQLRQRHPDRVTSSALRIVGMLCLGIAYAACGFHWGWIVGPVAWLCVLSATALVLVGLLAYRREPR